ncbi:MAG TPA: hypothetical protein VIM73_09580 [Polyangiaceae bacterium]
MTESSDSEFKALFAHDTRKDWGAGVLASVRDGKRTYLFESGEQRVMGSGASDMMRKIVRLDANQQSILARLIAVVARRQSPPEASKTASVMLLEQAASLRRAFPEGLADPAWQSEGRAAEARETVLPQAQELLSRQALDAQLKAQQFDAVWGSASNVLVATRWLPADHLKPAPSFALGLLAAAVRELLYATGPIEQRVDRFSVAFETAFRRSPRWEVTTALLTLVHPNEHVLVDVLTFRKQLKVLGSKGSLPQSPSGSAYLRCLNAARVISNKLTEQGDTPRDLLDVHDVIRFTLKASSPARQPKKLKAVKKSVSSLESDGASDPSDEVDT